MTFEYIVTSAWPERMFFAINLIPDVHVHVHVHSNATAEVSSARAVLPIIPDLVLEDLSLHSHRIRSKSVWPLWLESLPVRQNRPTLVPIQRPSMAVSSVSMGMNVSPSVL